ncbi:MAG: TIGR03746 family integrating conjugative element protein [Shewanella xiamenensis]|nr:MULTISPECIES: TIGR03746 family integrating conjugative element protein [Shewanella]MCD8549900.1 TIGR03746 family integrating conjugative element protein [Shewanella xiamenensis]MCD8557453.1 TIGR03746 family integrating conjugative element protein [Shewanella xiamenensis]MCK7657705.1 TIGR03746 family integrating conjugative element protein [Shewanella sp. JNE4-2]MCT8858085.1 TIGR03746 family integrating conjugative element protein [Shewanella xiamenensis]MDH0451025.1 TIGR03746 family integra
MENKTSTTAKASDTKKTTAVLKKGRASKPRNPTHRSLPKKYYKAEAEEQSHILTLRVGGVTLAVLLGMSLYAASKIPDEITVHNPPNMEVGSTRKLKEIPQYSLYSTALYIWQQINTANDMSKDYRNNVELKFSNYISPEFGRELVAASEREDKANKTGISREFREMDGATWSEQRVFKLTPDKWVVYVDGTIKERLAGQVVREVNIRYPLVLERADYNPAKNPTGLKIVGFHEQPKRL